MNLIFSSISIPFNEWFTNISFILEGNDDISTSSNKIYIKSFFAFGIFSLAISINSIIWFSFTSGLIFFMNKFWLSSSLLSNLHNILINSVFPHPVSPCRITGIFAYNLNNIKIIFL